jgi:hypothetical protein
MPPDSTYAPSVAAFSVRRSGSEIVRKGTSLKFQGKKSFKGFGEMRQLSRYDCAINDYGGSNAGTNFERQARQRRKNRRACQS